MVKNVPGAKAIRLIQRSGDGDGDDGDDDGTADDMISNVQTHENIHIC